MFMVCGKKPKYIQKIHACMARTYKLHLERILTGDLLTERQQFHQVSHCATLLQICIAKK